MDSWLVTMKNKNEEIVKAEAMEIDKTGAIEFFVDKKKEKELVKRFEHKEWERVVKQ